MNKVILFGGTGKLGTKIAASLKNKNYHVTAVVRSDDKAQLLKPLVNETLVADVSNPDELTDICKGFDIVISSLGKSVSLKDKSKPGFKEIDLDANKNILKEALAASVKKFIYVSAFGAEDHMHLNYFKYHAFFSEKLKRSGIDYSIIKPPAIMSSFIDLIEMAKNGKLITIGKGDKVTNPIYEGDLADICVESIKVKNATVAAGGKMLYTRSHINEIIQHHINSDKKVKTVPMSLMKITVPFIRLINKNTYDKFAFYLEVMKHDTAAPKLGNTTLEQYLSEKMYLN